MQKIQLECFRIVEKIRVKIKPDKGMQNIDVRPEE